MKKFVLAILSCMLLMSTAVSADYLQIADEQDNGELRDYVYASGVAEDPVGETKRLYIYNYMLQREKQKSDYAQAFYANAFEQSGKREELNILSEASYKCAEDSNKIQSEIDKNQGYLDRINSSPAKLKKADRLAGAVPKEKEENKGWRIAADVALSAALVVLIVFAMRKINKWGRKEGLI
ncbi:MAG: hypothetical protein ACI4SS_06880 [Clostridia bacterium]